MKRIILVSILFTFSYLSKAQITKDSLINKLSKEACTEFSKKDITKIDKANIEQEMGMMFLPVIMNNMADIEKVYNVKITDAKGMQAVAQDMAMRMSFNCPAFLNFSMEMAKDETVLKRVKEKMGTIDASANTNTATQVKGILQSFTPSEFSSFTVKEKTGKLTKVYWLESFDNADNIKDNMKKYLNKNVIVNFESRNIYDAVKKNYKTIKVITSLDLQ